MCQYKSGVIFKNRVELTPTYNDSHSRTLERLKVEDNHLNATKMFVRAELVPPNDDRATDPKTWKYIVDQDVVPDWYEKDPGKYEQMFRRAVEEWVTENTVVILGHSWTAIKEDENGTYYLLNGSLGNSKFGDANNYNGSELQKFINGHKLAEELKKEFGDRLVPITTNLLSLDGLKDYGTIAGDILAIPTLDLYRECRENIPNISEWWWTATPDSTPSGYGASDVRIVYSVGGVDCGGCKYSRAVRPFCILPFFGKVAKRW